MEPSDGLIMDTNNNERCAVCGDKSNGKHYGVAACYGCKGFFRRTIRSSQTYTCRFNSKCLIDKDQRNACRYCRFRRCLEVGMEPEAIRPDRDVIGKQKNPRKRKMKRESSSLPSPGNLENINYMDNSDMLLSYLIDIEMKNHPAQIQNQNEFNSPIGISHNFMKIKQDPDSNTYSLLTSATILNSVRIPMPGEAGRIATVEQFNHAMRSYVILAIDWINSLFELAQIDNVTEKMIMLRNAFGSFCTLHKATTTSQYANDENTVVLCNGSLIQRNLPRHLFELQFFANNIISKLIDEVVLPLKRFMINDVERVALIALTFLDGEFRGMSEQTMMQLNIVKERIQMALFHAIKERTHNVSTAANRFAGLLLTLPSVAKLSTLYIENVQMAKMFGAQQMDRFVLEVVTNSSSTPEPLSPSKNKHDAETQTSTFAESEELGRIGNELVALGLDLSANPPIGSVGTSSDNSATSPIPSISSSSSSLSTQTTAMNKPPPLIVHQNPPSSSHHNSPIASSAPVYPFYNNYTQGYPSNQMDQQMNHYSYNTVHTNGIQSAGPFNQQSFFNHQQQSHSATANYQQQNCFKF